MLLHPFIVNQSTGHVMKRTAVLTPFNVIVGLVRRVLNLILPKLLSLTGLLMESIVHTYL